jgi:LAO/AO transport system kinase
VTTDATRRPPRDAGDLRARLDAARRGDRKAIGRLLTIAERDGDDAEALAALLAAEGAADRPPAHVVGITGAPGAGKSTLTGALLATWVAASRRVAVLAVDPSSPISGGAILGDRIRMDGRVDGAEDRTFIRSLASRGERGGLALAVLPMINVLEAVGFDLVVVETVGVGQVELDIAALADTTVVVVTPGWGDAVQTSKAGLLEIADVFAVNKADKPGASDAVRDLEHMLDLGPRDDPHRRRAPIVRTVATDGTGVDELATEIERHAAHLDERDSDVARRDRRRRAEVRVRVQHELTRAIDAQLAATPIDGARTPHEIARDVIASLGSRVDAD